MGKHEPTNSEWASAIALRIADEMELNYSDQVALEEVLSQVDVSSLVGTGIIEEDYWENDIEC